MNGYEVLPIIFSAFGTGGGSSLNEGDDAWIGQEKTN